MKKSTVDDAEAPAGAEDSPGDARSPFLALNVRLKWAVLGALALVALVLHRSIVEHLNQVIPDRPGRFFPLMVLVSLLVPTVVSGYRKVYKAVTGIDLEADEDEDDGKSNSKSQRKARRKEQNDAGATVDALQARRTRVDPADLTEALGTAPIGPLHSHLHPDEDSTEFHPDELPPDLHHQEADLVDRYA